MKNLTFTIIAILMLLSYCLHYELRMERKSLKEVKNSFKIDSTNVSNYFLNEIRIKDSIVMDIEGIVKDKKDCIRFKQIYNKAK